MDVLAKLNPAQRQAVETIQGPLLIIAGPGSGKTRVITHRVAYLVKVCGINPRRIMAVTFTNKAAREMKERLEKLLGQTAEALTLGTFHAICARILRQEGAAIGLARSFVIYDDEDQTTLIKQSLKELDIDPKQYTPRAIQSAIGFAKSHQLTPADYAQRTSSYFEEIVSRVYQHYQHLLSQSQGVDFDDLLLRTVQLFDAHPKILAKYQSRYLHIMVDEFQDTNVTQYMLIKQLAGKHRNLCVVGDPDQSIYSWRYADLRNILSFEKDYPDATVAILEQNYRSTKTILDVASNIIAANVRRIPKKLTTENEVGLPLTIVETYDEGEEARFILNEMENLISQNTVSPGGCAVMYRVNAQSRALEEAFMRYGVPYKLVGGTRFYQRREVKDIIAYLRLIHNPCDNISLNRIINVPTRGIGQRTLAELSAWAKSQDMPLFSALELVIQKQGPPFTPRISYALASFCNLVSDLVARSKETSLMELLDTILEKAEYRAYILNEEEGDERWENVLELRAAAGEFNDLPPQEALTAFLEKISLVSDVDELEEQTSAPTLITLHQAKGLEFPVVFIVGVEEGLLPHQRSMDDPGEMEEERRLCYVGVTRAQKRVYLMHSYRRSLFGGSAVNKPSRFINDIPAHLVTSINLWAQEEAAEKKKQEAITYTPVTALFARRSPPLPPRPINTIKLQVGDLVRHQVFGDGVVKTCSPNGTDQEITVAFSDAGTKRLLLSLAPLEKIENN